ncbi:hypothetical protein TMES_11785 [Thalassospira mesophila]|uniref:Uncharacterized protein n=1 Tax=Thalassospira mesophila TaxID=1293891 RepID=A0A1Y2L073_9PROT|nr:hypothetical protein TMES_11785 [Thalassospira mesophila]
MAISCHFKANLCPDRPTRQRNYPHGYNFVLKQFPKQIVVCFDEKVTGRSELPSASTPETRNLPSGLPMHFRDAFARHAPCVPVNVIWQGTQPNAQKKNEAGWGTCFAFSWGQMVLGRPCERGIFDLGGDVVGGNNNQVTGGK